MDENKSIYSQSRLDLQQDEYDQSNDLNDKLQVWKDDEVSPQSLFFSYRKNIKLVWTSKATFRLCFKTGELMDLVLHQDETVVLLKDKGHFGT